MPSLLDSYTPSTRCWFPDKDLGWVSGHVTNKQVDGEDVRVEFVDENGKVSLACLSFASRGRRGSEHPLSAHDGRLAGVKELERNCRNGPELLGGRLAREKTALLRTGTRLGVVGTEARHPSAGRMCGTFMGLERPWEVVGCLAGCS